MKLQNLHLIISSSIVLIMAFIYGFVPDLLFDIHIKSTDEANVFKAIMGLYLGFGIFWVFGIFKPQFWQEATICNGIFMLGLGFGRIISFGLNGWPSTLFVLGAFGELVLGFYSLYQLNATQK